ncbi:MAG: amino acid ABC transporter permease [Acidaminobacteraceae bacterium]
MKKLGSFLVAIGVYISFFYFVMVRSIDKSMDFAVYSEYAEVIFKGWITTIQISVISVLLSLIVGLILFFMQESKSQILRYLSEIHKTIIFGTPLIVLATVAYYYIGFAFGIESRFWVGVITLALYIGAYIADIYKGAIESIHKNQLQAATMFGFSRYQTYRYIIFPQVVMSILPPLAGQFALTVKGSALLSYMATDEFFNTIKTVQSVSFRYSEGFVLVALGYLIITIPLIRLIRYLENRLNYRM